MWRLAVAALALALTSLAAPAAAFVVEVTTSIAVEDVRDEAQLRDALQKTVGLLLADQDGERTFQDLEREPESTEVKL